MSFSASGEADYRATVGCAQNPSNALMGMLIPTSLPNCFHLASFALPIGAFSLSFIGRGRADMNPRQLTVFRPPYPHL